MHYLNNDDFNYKKLLRKFYKDERLKLSEKEKADMDYAIYLNLINFSDYIDSKKILTYASKYGEVDTWNIISHCWNNEKKVAVPKCRESNSEMYFYMINSTSDLALGTYEIYEPIISRCRIVEDFSDSLCIVPGLCFDQNGYRIGYGKGYYDRFLKNFNNIKIGICYSNCIMGEAPHSTFDQPVNVLITDKYIRIVN